MENWEKNVKSRFWKSKSKENTDFDLEKWNLDKNPGQNSSETSQKWSMLSGNHLGKKNFFIQKKIFFLVQKSFLIDTFYLDFPYKTWILMNFTNFKISKIVSTVETKDRMKKRTLSGETSLNFRVLNFLNFSTLFIR